MNASACSAKLYWVLMALSMIATETCAQSATTGAELSSGAEIYRAACVACHGPGGSGQPKDTVGFDPPDSFPDFTRCDQTTSESNETWGAIIRNGGPPRGASSIMPSFGAALTPKQIAAVVAHLRTFCRESAWPPGELNFARSVATEKAYPEDEDVLTLGFNTGQPAGIDGELGFERRIGARNQIEVAVPFGRTYSSEGELESAIGDVAVGFKHVLAWRLSPDATRGSIFSVQGEIVLPTGRRLEGLGTGEAAFGLFASYGQLFPGMRFLQVQAGTELPRHTSATPANIYLRAAAGQSLQRDDQLGRLWTPMLEITASRDLAGGQTINWDAIPQLQLTLSRRRHVRAGLGFLLPLTDIADRAREIMLYVLWDTGDGGLLEGW